MLNVSKFTVEYRKNPIGLNEKNPRFSWVLESDNREILQKSYRLTVANESGDVVWDSGEVFSEQSVLVEYVGRELAVRTRYEVILTVKDNKYETSDSRLTFETGLMGEPIEGEFISHNFSNCVPEFRKVFSAKKNVKRARLFATALGVYEIFLNGTRVGDLYDAPGWTSYTHRLQYQAYDVTGLLVNNNEIRALVAPGWYAGVLGYFHQKNCYGERTAFCMTLYIEYKDGKKEVVKTDGSWKVSESALRFSEFQDGEFFDSTFIAKEELSVDIIDYDKQKIVGQICEPVRVTEILPARQLIITPKGERVLDFGQNASGIVTFTYRGKRGDTVTLRHAEALDKDGNFYTENLRAAKAEDSWILNGEVQTLCPRFTSHGFRYAQLIGFGEKINLSDFKMLVIHSDMEQTSRFECENKEIQQLHSNIVWGQRGNFLDIPTDCPQRDERLGWTADAQVFCRTAAFNYNVASFFAKWLGDLAAEQTKKNGVPHTVPNVIPGNEVGAAVWGDAATIVPWTMYRVYGDKRLLQNQYESMKSWVDYIRTNAENDLWQKGFQFGDWLALDKEEFSDRTGATDKYFIASVYYAYSAELVAKAAAALGREQDAEEYAALHDKIIKAIRREYITQTGRLVSETQTACVLALAFNIIQEEFRPRIIRMLKDNLKDHKDHLVTGFVGTPLLCHALTENGMHELAAKLLLNDDYPSWLYEVKMGATTVWERWNGIKENGELFEPGMNSFNHYAYGSIGDWIYRKVAGIDELEPGYKKILISPRPIKDLGDMTVKFQSAYGVVGVAFRYEGEELRIKIQIPANTRAEFRLPSEKTQEVGSGLYEFVIPAELAITVNRNDKRLKEISLGAVCANAECEAILRENLPEADFCQIKSYAANRSLADLLEAMPFLREKVEAIVAKLSA